MRWGRCIYMAAENKSVDWDKKVLKACSYCDKYEYLMQSFYFHPSKCCVNDDDGAGFCDFTVISPPVSITEPRLKTTCVKRLPVLTDHIFLSILWAVSEDMFACIEGVSRDKDSHLWSSFAQLHWLTQMMMSFPVAHSWMEMDS